jgi:hypothetical protein
MLVHTRFIPHALACTIALACASRTHAQEVIAAIDSSNDRVVLLDAATGDVLNGAFITDANDSLTYDFQTPRGITQVGNEVWVTEQLGNAIYRFAMPASPSEFATYVGRIVTGVDNVRGINFINGKVYVANAGNSNGAPGPAILVFNPDGSFDSSFPTIDPYDVIGWDGKLMVTDINNDDLLLYTFNGTLDSTFHNSDGVTGIDFAQQLDVAPTGAGGTLEVWCAGFTPPGGIYRYNANGTQAAYSTVAAGGARGVRALSSNAFIFTDGTGLYRRTSAPLATETLSLGSFQGTGRLSFPIIPVCDSVDFNNDTLTPDSGDLDDFLAVFSGGPTACSSFPVPGCNDLDFNNDGLFPDAADLDAFISRLGGGACLR